MEDIDIWRAAKLAIDQYGALAAFYAMAREFHLADVGDIAGAAVWGKIFDAIEELRRIRPPTRSIRSLTERRDRTRRCVACRRCRWAGTYGAAWRHRSLNDTMTVLHKNMTESNARRYLR
jgi:hypothetical protein